MKVATRVFRRLIGRPKRKPIEGRERSADWYDEMYHSTPEYAKHYTQSRYYPLWAVLIDRLRLGDARSVLDVGCGVGQFADALAAALPNVTYRGFDFSPKAIKRAKEHNPGLSFEVADALATDLYQTTDYDTVICTEVLEHITEDIQVVRSVPAGIRFLGSVPNFPSASHVRYFDSERQVMDRYAPCFDTLAVTTLMYTRKGQRMFILDGRTFATT